MVILNFWKGALNGPDEAVQSDTEFGYERGEMAHRPQIPIRGNAKCDNYSSLTSSGSGRGVGAMRPKNEGTDRTDQSTMCSVLVWYGMHLQAVLYNNVNSKRFLARKTMVE